MAKTNIAWTDKSWNPVTGCTKISPGCTHCYAEIMAHRLKEMGQPNYVNGFDLTLQPHMLDHPLHWKKPSMIFVNSMSDIFHADVPLDYIRRVFDVMHKCPQHVFQVLTKRAGRMQQLSPQLEWHDNVWMGVTVENADYQSRIDCLRKTGAKLKFLSLEPLLSALPNLNLDGIGWVIVAGESGHGCRPMHPDWVRDIRDQCIKAKIPFFFKQWGGVRKNEAGNLLDGETWEQMPGEEMTKAKKTEELCMASTRAKQDGIDLSLLHQALVHARAKAINAVVIPTDDGEYIVLHRRHLLPDHSTETN